MTPTHCRVGKVTFRDGSYVLPRDGRWHGHLPSGKLWVVSSPTYEATVALMHHYGYGPRTNARPAPG